jgi:hypothetical protein
MSYESHPKKECNEDVYCHLEPCLPKLKVVFTSPEFFLREHPLKALKGLASNRLDSMESVHNVGLDMGVLSGPTKSQKLLASSTLSSFDESPTAFTLGKDGLTC